MPHADRTCPSLSVTDKELVELNAVLITAHQLDRAFQAHGTTSDKALDALRAFAENESLLPTCTAAKALVLRITLFRDLLDQWIEDEDCVPYLEAAAGAGLIPRNAPAAGERSFQFDPDQFDALLALGRSRKLDSLAPLPPSIFDNKS